MRIKRILFHTITTILAGWALVMTTASAYAQEENPAAEKKQMFDFNASYIGDFAGTPLGGQRTGFGYLGYGVLGVTFDTEAAGWWKGGQLVLSGATTHGATPTESWMGDFQVADNIEAGNHIFFNELYFQQQLGPVTLTAGLQDFNSHYANSDASSLFLNSSFGINSILSSSFSVPIFPIFSWGLNMNWGITDWLSWQVGTYDSPFGFDENPYNIHWRFNQEKGAIFATEFAFHTNIRNNLEGTFEMGGAYQTALNNFELHLIAEQQFWKKDNRSMSAFLTAAYSPKTVRDNHFHASTGFHFVGVFSKKGNDQLGIAASTCILNNDFKHETVLELTYQYAFGEHFYLQPDIQYILNPAGAESKTNNTMFLALRFGIDF